MSRRQEVVRQQVRRYLAQLGSLQHVCTEPVFILMDVPRRHKGPACDDHAWPSRWSSGQQTRQALLPNGALRCGSRCPRDATANTSATAKMLRLAQASVAN